VPSRRVGRALCTQIRPTDSIRPSGPGTRDWQTYRYFHLEHGARRQSIRVMSMAMAMEGNDRQGLAQILRSRLPPSAIDGSRTPIGRLAITGHIFGTKFRTLAEGAPNCVAKSCLQFHSSSLHRLVWGNVEPPENIYFHERSRPTTLHSQRSVKIPRARRTANRDSVASEGILKRLAITITCGPDA